MRRNIATALVLTLIKVGISVTAFLAVYGVLGRMAYIERGYDAVGGEVIAAAIVGAGAYLLAESGIRYAYRLMKKKTSDRNHRGSRVYDGH